MVCPIKQRTRSSLSMANVDTINLKSYAYSDGSLMENVDSTCYTGQIATITDEITAWELIPEDVRKKKGACDWKKAKPFRNLNHVRRYLNANVFESLSAGYSRFNDNKEQLTVFDAGHLFERSPLEFVKPQDIEVRDAFMRLEPSLEEAKIDKFNVYTAVLELADLKKTFTKSVFALSKTFFGTAAEKWLWYNFGVKPVVSDIKNIYAIVTKLDGYIDKWNKAASSGVIWDHHEVIYTHDVDKNNWEIAGGDINYRLVFHKALVSASSPFTIESRAHLYFKPKPISAQARAKIKKAAWGLDKPLSGVWEAIPFSWAIDYFLQVGEFIDAYETDILNYFNYEFVSSGYSTKATCNAQLLYHWVAGQSSTVYYPSTFPVDHSAEINDSIYVRNRVPMKAFFDFVAKPDPSLTANLNLGYRQASYLASVAYLRSRR